MMDLQVFKNLRIFLEKMIKNENNQKKFSLWSINIIVNGLLLAIPISFLFGFPFTLELVIGLGFARYITFDLIREYNMVSKHG